MSILQTIDLKKYYGTEPNITRALDGVNFSVEDGEFVTVVGTSGRGDVLCVRGPVFTEFHQVIAAVLHLLEQPEHYVPAVAVVEELVRG